MFKRLSGWIRRHYRSWVATRLFTSCGRDHHKLGGDDLRFIRDHGSAQLREGANSELGRREHRLGERRRQRETSAHPEVPPEGTRCALCSSPADVYSSFIKPGAMTPVCTPCIDREFSEASHDSRVQLQPGTGYGKCHGPITPHRYGGVTPDDASAGDQPAAARR